MTINAALSMGNIVKTKIEEEIHKHQHPEQHGESDASLEDAVGGEDVKEEMEEMEAEDVGAGAADASAGACATTPGGTSTKGRGGEGYFSDESSAASPRRMEV